MSSTNIWQIQLINRRCISHGQWLNIAELSHPGWVPKAEPVVRSSEVTYQDEPLVGGPSICMLPGCTRQRFLDGVTGHDTCSRSPLFIGECGARFLSSTGKADGNAAVTLTLYWLASGQRLRTVSSDFQKFHAAMPLISERNFGK